MSQNITPTPLTDRPEPTREQIKKWRRYLAEEISEAKVYSQLAERSEGREAEILRKVAEAEHRHQQHWRNLLGEHAHPEPRPSVYARLLQFLARHFGTVFVLALAILVCHNKPCWYVRGPNGTISCINRLAAVA